MEWKWKWLCVVALVVAVPACTRVVLDLEKMHDLVPGAEWEITVEPVSAEQKIKVDLSAQGGAVNVFVFLAKDKAAAHSEILAKKPSSKILAHAMKTEATTLEPTIPANESAVVMVTNAAGKLTKVKVKLTN